MPKLVLKVSPNVPELPAAVRKEKGLTVKRVKTFTRESLRATAATTSLRGFSIPSSLPPMAMS